MAHLAHNRAGGPAATASSTGFRVDTPCTDVHGIGSWTSLFDDLMQAVNSASPSALPGA